MTTMLVMFLLAAAALAGASSADVAPPVPRAVTVTAEVAAGADSLTVLWRFALADGWHLYAPYRNDSGYPPEVRLDLPAGWTAGPLRWPAPERLILAGEILDHVYHDELVLAQTIRPAAGSAANRAAVTARWRWLACRQPCVPGDTPLTVAVPAAADAGAAARRVLAAVPGPLPSGTASVAREPAAVRVTVTGARALTLVPDVSAPPLVDLIADGAAPGDELVLRLRPGPAAAAPFDALLIIDRDDGSREAGTIRIP